MARHRRAVLAAWTAVLLACAALYPSLHEVLSEPNNSIDNSQSLQAEHRLQSAGFRGAGDEQDAIVFFSSRHRAFDFAYRQIVARVLHAVRPLAGVQQIDGPYAGAGARAQIAPGGHAAFARLALSGEARGRFKDAEAIQAAAAAASGSGVRAWLTGVSALSKDLSSTESRDGERGEAIGLPIAFVVLVMALGALGAALVPLLLAGSGVLLTSGTIALLGRLLDFDVFLLTLVTMIGVGIGIDYSLFIVSRFREELARLPPTPRAYRRSIAHAVGTALATSGRTVFYSGAIVALSLSSLLVMQAPVFREFAIGAAVSVFCTLLAALTLLPAALAQLGLKVNAGLLPARLRPAELAGAACAGDGGWARWALRMMRRPLAVSLAAVSLLLLAMTPVLSLRSGIALDLPSLAQTPSGEGAQALGRYFSAGMTAPLEIVVSGHASRRREVVRAAQALAAELRADRRVDALAVRAYPAGAVLTVVPAVAIDSAAAQALVRRIRARLARVARSRYGAQVLVGGWPAQSLDASTESIRKLPLVLAITLGAALLLLLVVFRSVVLPLKAVAMNLLATGATLGLVVAVFQQGHGERLLGFSSPGFIQAYLPLCMFVLLFGLSMDYEIFLIRRMQETWRQTRDNRRAVAAGVEHTGRPITAAAAIMVAVFGSSGTAHALELKQFGFALAAAIAIDATLVRLVLVPAFMCLLGRRNWWLPDGLARVLPRLEVG